MIETLSQLDPHWDFIKRINADHAIADPMFDTWEKLEKHLEKTFTAPDRIPLGVFRDGAMTGLFVFLVVESERYIEMLDGLSREPDAYEEIADWLQAHYPGYQVDFVFNPQNTAIRPMLLGRGAVFATEQFKMVLTETPPPVDTAGIEPLSERYREQYAAMHNTDNYWTAERLLNALDKFAVFIAVDGGTVVGYIDVTKNNEENEPFDLLVREDRRGRGWGRKLLAKAIEANRPKGMMLTVDVDNDRAIALYRSMGFTYDPEPINQVATWMIERRGS